MTYIEIPDQFNRNSAKVLALGVENTGATILACGNELLGLPDLSGKDILDIGCGTRFTQTIINRNLPIGSCTGIDINQPLIHFLTNYIQDSRFSFHYWDVYNEIYNPSGQTLTKNTKLPLPDENKFDVIWMYSVITHNYPTDTECLLSILRAYIKPEGGLLFSAFLDNTVNAFEDKLNGQPLSMACYNETFLREIITKTGWQLETLYTKKPDSVLQDLMLCRLKFDVRTD